MRKTPYLWINVRVRPEIRRKAEYISGMRRVTLGEVVEDAIEKAFDMMKDYKGATHLEKEKE